MNYGSQLSDDSRAGRLIAGISVGSTAASTGVILRLYVRRRTRVPLGLDDWLIVAALFSVLAQAILIAVSIHYGNGRHFVYITNLRGFFITWVLGEIPYCLGIVFTKLSILALYNKIFISQNLKRVSIGIGILVIAYNFVICVLDLVECIPLSKLWNSDESGTCIPAGVAISALAIVNVVTDIGILALPVNFVRKLQLSRTRKFQTLGLFALGGLVCIFGIIRVHEVVTISPTDQSWNGVDGALWSALEVSIGVLSACLPTLGPLLQLRSHNSSNENEFVPFKTNTKALRPETRLCPSSHVDHGVQSDVGGHALGIGKTPKAQYAPVRVNSTDMARTIVMTHNDQTV